LARPAARIGPESVSPSTVFTAVVVEPCLTDSITATLALGAAGYQVTVCDFREAKARLVVAAPNLLVADVRQGNFNGLQLVLRGRAARRRLAAIVTTRHDDAVLQREAESLGATYILKPVGRDEFLAAVARTLWRSTGVDGSDPIRRPFERRHCERRKHPSAEVVDPERRKGGRRRTLLVPMP
jgi:DNA-binding response OmpR family regulator